MHKIIPIHKNKLPFPYTTVYPDLDIEIVHIKGAEFSSKKYTHFVLLRTLVTLERDTGTYLLPVFKKQSIESDSGILEESVLGGFKKYVNLDCEHYIEKYIVDENAEPYRDVRGDYLNIYKIIDNE